MLVLERKGSEVFCDGKKLTINAQASKDPNKEVVKIAGLEGSNGQTWVSLSRLQEGINEIETQARTVTARKKYSLTEAEQTKINKLQAEIDSIIEVAKSRYVPNLSVKDLEKNTSLTKEQKIEYLQKLLDKFSA